MILETLKSNRPFNYFLFLVTGALFWINSFRFPSPYNYFDGENGSMLFSPVYKITARVPLIQVVIAFALVLMLAFVIQQINSRFALIKSRTKLPIVIYIIIVGGFTTMHTLHPVYFGGIFLLLAINSLFSVFNNPKPQIGFFNSGFFIAIGSLFYFNLLIVLPAFLIAVNILRRERKISEYFILIIGLIIPMIFALSYAFYTGQLNDTFITIQKNILTPVNLFMRNYPLQGFMALLIFMTVIGSVKLIRQYDSRKVSNRKYFTVLFVIFIFSVLSFTFVPATSLEMLVISALPLTFLISNLFVSIESGFWRELLFILFLATAVLMQFADKLTPVG